MSCDCFRESVNNICIRCHKAISFIRVLLEYLSRIFDNTTLVEKHLLQCWRDAPEKKISYERKGLYIFLARALEKLCWNLQIFYRFRPFPKFVFLEKWSFKALNCEFCQTHIVDTSRICIIENGLHLYMICRKVMPYFFSAGQLNLYLLWLLLPENNAQTCW